MSQGRRMAVTVAPSCEVVVPAGSVPPGSDEGPDEADRSQPVVLHPPVGNADAAAGRLGDRCRSGERLESTSIGEAGAVVTDLGQHAGAGDVAQADERGDDLVVRVLG